jgi:hypothetical protein
MRRYTAQLLLRTAASALLTVSALLPAFPSSTTGNIVENPSFEEPDEMGDPAGWGWWGSETGQMGVGELFQCEPDAHTGDWSISIREEAWGNRGYWHTVLHGIKPHRWYAVSVWAKRDRPTGWVPQTEVFGQNRVINLRQPNVWQRFDWLLDSGEFSGSAVLKLVNSRKPCKVWFDDVTVEEFSVEALSPVERRRLSWRPSFTSRLVVFEIEMARTVSFDPGLRSLGRTLNEEISLPNELPPGDWFWRVKAFQNGSLLAVSPPQRITVEPVEPPLQPTPPKKEVLPLEFAESTEHISFDANLNLLVDGTAFFPVGIYSLPPELFKEAKRAGFNVVVTNEVEAAQRAGLRAMVHKGFTNTPGKSDETVPVSQGEADCWIIARYLCDEPDQTNVSPKEAFRAHVQEKEADPLHPTASVIYRPESFGDYASASDILMTDPYPIPHRPLTVVSESVRAAREAVRDRKPVWAIIQAFNWGDVSQEARRIGWARWPTYAEERCMAHLAVINGANGILFYGYGGSNHNPSNWRALKRVAGELKRISPILLSRTLSLPVSVSACRMGEIEEADEGERIECTLKSHAGRTYLIAANDWPGKRRVTFSFEKPLREIINLPFEKRRIRTDEQSFSDIFEPYGVHVYELDFR